MLIFNFDPLPTITTSRLVLRAMRDSDAEDFFYLRSHPVLMQYIPRPRANTVADALAVIHSYHELARTQQGANWAITLAGEDRLIGAIGFFRPQAAHYRAEIGYMLHDAWHGKGIMPEALEAMTSFGFRTLQLHSIEAVIDPANIASEKLLQKAGYVKEGHFLEAEFYNGEFLDSVIYSKLSPYPFDRTAWEEGR
jgi:ribosomal-protein-alanine N-acetyltransferase